MEPKTFDDYWEEGCKECIGEWSCKYIKTHWKWEQEYKGIEIWGKCSLDHFNRNCEGCCSRYEEKKPWYKRLFRKD